MVYPTKREHRYHRMFILKHISLLVPSEVHQAHSGVAMHRTLHQAPHRRHSHQGITGEVDV